MMKYRGSFSLIVVVAVALSGGWASPALSQSLDVTGYVRHYSGILVQEEGPYASIRNTFDLTVEHSRSRAAFYVNPYLYHNPSEFSDTNSDLEIGLRQAYMDVYFDALDLRLGKQQIIWGKADGVFITDVVTPKDMREFLLPDFEEIRVGVTALKLDYYRGDQTFEAVWVPVFTPTQKPEPESIWFAAPGFPILPDMDTSQEAVEKTFGNSEVFARYSFLGSAFDFELMAGYAWDDDPTMHTIKTLDPVTHQLTSLTVTPQHHRVALGGGSFSTTFGGVVVRGEGAYYSGKYFSSSDPQLPEGVVEKDYAHYLLGVDHTILGVDVSMQFIQQAILEYDDQMTDDQFENTVTLLFSKMFLRDTLRLEVFSYIGLNDSGALIRPKVVYDLADGFEILAGANLFVGDDGKFGQYDENDMLYAKITYSF